MNKKVKQNKFCIIGLGKHASENLLPSLRKANKRIIAYVSRTSKKETGLLFDLEILKLQ